MRAARLAAAAVLGLALSHAGAMGLGNVTIQSALGAPLRAEIVLLDLSDEEAASLRAAVAAPEMYQAAGVEYNPVLDSVKVTIVQRPDGSRILRLAGTRAVDAGWLDLLVEASTAAGRVMRDYTLLLEPAAARKP